MIANNIRHLTAEDSRFSICAVLYLSAKIHTRCKQQKGRKGRAMNGLGRGQVEQ